MWHQEIVSYENLRRYNFVKDLLKFLYDFVSVSVEQALTQETDKSVNCTRTKKCLDKKMKKNLNNLSNTFILCNVYHGKIVLRKINYSRKPDADQSAGANFIKVLRADFVPVGLRQ